MKLLVFYVGFVAIGETFAYFIGRTVEFWSKAASVPVFLACFFFVFWAAWRLAPRDLIVPVPSRKSCYFGTGAAADGFPPFETTRREKIEI